MSFDEYVKTNNLGKIEKNKSFKELTTIGTGGIIETLYYPFDIPSLQKAYKFIKDNKIKYFILGNGSNVLASDSYFDGIVIATKKLPSYINYFDNYIVVSAFYPTMKLALELSNRGLGDLSFLGGIPGLLGGAIYNNSGAYNEAIGDSIISVTYIDTSGKIRTISSLFCAFGYRRSIFHFVEGIIIKAKISVSKVETKEKLKERQEKRALSQPLGFKSMGSVFKNNPLIPSWRVIDSLGLRGFRIGGAMVSSKHTNFIINTGEATSSEIISIIELIETKASLEFGIKMIKEITLI